LIGSPFGDRSDFTHSDGEVVERECDGLGVKITAGEDSIGIGKNHGVIGGGVDFCLYDVSDVVDGFPGGAMDLRNAAEGVGILNVIFHFGRDWAVGE
jgi:hypothetical protein